MKKNNYSVLICLVCFILLLFSCYKPQPVSASEQILAGTWQWVRTDGGIANQIHETPASSGTTVELRITINRQYSIYTNDVLSSQGTFTFETQSCIHDNTSKDVIIFSSPAQQPLMIERIDNVNLELSDETYDGLGSLYIRK